MMCRASSDEEYPTKPRSLLLEATLAVLLVGAVILWWACNPW